MAMKACPYRKDFYEKLGSPEDVVRSECEEWVAALENIVAQIQAFIELYSSRCEANPIQWFRSDSRFALQRACRTLDSM